MRPKALKKKIDEIINLDRSDIEFIFVLEREDHNSLKIIKEIKSDHLKIIFNIGPHYHSFYIGAKAASGKYLKFMGDDDYLIIDNFNKQLDNIKLNPNIEWFVSGGIYYNNKKEKIRNIITKLKFFLLKNYKHKILTLANFIMTTSVIIKKDICFECGGFDRKYKYAQDYYCWLEVSSKYKPHVFPYFTSGATFDETTFSGSFSFQRYFEYLFKILKYQKNIFLKFFQIMFTFYITIHNFILKKIYKFFINIFEFIFKSKNRIYKLNIQNTKSIVHLTRKFDLKTLGGIEEGIIQLSQSNNPKKITNYLFACGNKNIEFEYKGLNIKIFKTSFILFNSHISFYLIYYLIKNHRNYDIFHIHSPWPTAEVIFSILKKTKIIITYHADIFKKSYLRSLYYIFYKRFINSNNINIINVSTKKYFEHSILKKILKSQDKIFFQGMGVDDLSKFDLRLDLVSNKIKNFYLNKEKILLFFGRDRHYKGIETVEHLILKSDYNFLISTTNEKLILYKNLPNVMIVDELNIDEKVFVLRNSYLHLFPSSNRSESLGIALIESQMCSLPAIIYDLNSGSSVIIKNRFNGLMANSNSKDDYLKQLNELMNDSNLRSDLANNSRQNYLDNFTQKSFKKYLEKIENLNI